MEELLNFIKEQIALIGNYPTWLYFATAGATLIITQLIKCPFKKFISSKIKNEVVRKKVNLIFMILPFGIALGINFGFSQLYGFNLNAGISSGFLAEFLYEFFKTLLKKANITDDSIKEAVKEAKHKAEEKKLLANEESKKLDNLLSKLK